MLTSLLLLALAAYAPASLKFLSGEPVIHSVSTDSPSTVAHAKAHLTEIYGVYPSEIRLLSSLALQYTVMSESTMLQDGETYTVVFYITFPTERLSTAVRDRREFLINHLVEASADCTHDRLLIHTALRPSRASWYTHERNMHQKHGVSHEVLKLILQNRASVHINEPEPLTHKTPLHIAAQYSFGDILKTFLAYDPDLEKTCADHKTALHCAVQAQDASIVHSLLSASAILDSKSLIYAVEQKFASAEVVEVLLNQRANPCARLEKGKLNALELAAFYGHANIVKILYDQSGIKSLEEAINYNRYVPRHWLKPQIDNLIKEVESL